MRISTRRTDPGYPVLQRYLKRKALITVTLNGEPVSDVVTADEEQGFVVTQAGNGEAVSRGGVVVISVQRGEG